MTATVRRHPRTLWRRIHDGVLLLAAGRDEPVLASGVAASVWLLLGDDGAAVGSLTARVVAAGLPDGAPPDGGVGDAVELLAGAGLVTVDGDRS